MNTTSLFVELVVIGIGAGIWLALIIFSIFGYDWVPQPRDLFSLIAFIPVLSIIYVLGIIIDRIADVIFDAIWVPSLRNRYYDPEKKDHWDRRLIYVHSGRLTDIFEYGRSRIRICRGWTLNFALILVSLNIFVWTRLSNQPLKMEITIFGSLILILMIFGSWFAWRQLALTDYRKVKQIAEFLRVEGLANKDRTEEKS